MPLAIGAPVARVSTMIVDDDLNMGSTHRIYTNRVSPATYGVVYIDLAAATDVIREQTPGLGTQMYHPAFTSIFTLAASDTNKASDDAEENTTSATYTKIKEIAIPNYYRHFSQVRAVFDLRSNGAAATAYCQIYVNGMAVGTERGVTSATPTTYSEDITVGPGDTVELWCKASGTTPYAYVSNYKINADEVINHAVKGAAW